MFQIRYQIRTICAQGDIKAFKEIKRQTKSLEVKVKFGEKVEKQRIKKQNDNEFGNVHLLVFDLLNTSKFGSLFSE